MTIDEEINYNKLLKKDFNKLGICLLFQNIIFYVIGMIMLVSETIIIALKRGTIEDLDSYKLFSQIYQNGVTVVIPVLIGFIPFLLYRKKDFFKYDLKIENKTFNLKTILSWTSIILAVNYVFGLGSNLIELGLNHFGLTGNSCYSILEGSKTFSMLLYTCLLSPVIEEFIYRGIILRSLDKYEKSFAIISSALLFALIHGNILQFPSAIAIGLILGYLAEEYSIKLTIIIHILNNLFSEIMSLLALYIGDNILMAVNSAIILVLLGIVIKLYMKNKIKVDTVVIMLFKNLYENKKYMIKFFTSIFIILTVAYDVYNLIASITFIQ